MRPWRLSATKTLWPNSTGFVVLPRLMRSVWGSKMENTFSSTGTCSPASTRRRVCAMTRSAKPQKWSISWLTAATRPAAIEQGAVPREVDVGLDDGGIDAELGAVLEAERDGGLDDGHIEGAHRGRGQPAESAMKGIVFGDRLAIEGREAPQGVAVGNALAQFAEIPRFDALEHKGPQGLGGAQTGPAGVGMLESPHQVVMDEGDQFFMGIQEVGEGPQGRLEREALGLPFEIGEAQRVGAGPHRRGRRRCASKNCRWATDIAWLRSLSRLPSSTHAATVSRQAMGMYTVRVVCASFQVNRAVGCSGPVVAHRQRGRPH